MLTHRGVTIVHPKYILTRWRKDVRRKRTYMLSNCDDIRKEPHVQRFDKMCNKFFDIAELGAKSEDKCAIIVEGLDELMERVMKGDSMCASNQPTHEVFTSLPSLGESRVLSPMAV